MEPREAARLASILHLPAGITITSIHPSATELVIRVACHAASMPCPECHQPSTRIHGNYERTVADLPCAGRNVLLLFTVRKFICSTPTCSHKIFTERLPGLVCSYGRITPRLIALVQSLGLVAPTGYATRLKEASREKRSTPLWPPVRMKGGEGKRETKIDRVWQKVGSIGKRRVKMGALHLSTEESTSRRGPAHRQLMRPANREPGQREVRSHRQQS